MDLQLAFGERSRRGHQVFCVAGVAFAVHRWNLRGRRPMWCILDAFPLACDALEMHPMPHLPHRMQPAVQRFNSAVERGENYFGLQIPGASQASPSSRNVVGKHACLQHVPCLKSLCLAAAGWQHC